MRIFRFDAEVAHPIKQYGSENAAIGRGVRFSGHEGLVQVGCLHIGPGGVVGNHLATVRQIFMVVLGSGWVRGEERERTPIVAGQAAFWETGEWHESGSESGMMAILVESDALDPGQYMPEIT